MKKLITAFCFSMFVLACSETEILNETGKLEVNEMQLPNLPDGYYYEAWLLVDGSYVSVGKINNDSIANNRARFSNIEMGDLSSAQSFAITVETTSGAPSDYVLLLGDFNGGSAQLSTNNNAQNGVQSLANRISAAYTVQNASVPATEQANYGTNGIWFFKGTDQKETTLHLNYTELSYQAWLVKTDNNNDWNLNMGVIKSDTLADTWKSFIPAPFAQNIPNFPGEDFLQQPGSGTSFPDGFFPLDVKGGKVIITPIFSNYNNAEIPFPIHLLEAIVPNDAIKDPNLTREFQINATYSAKAVKQ